MQTRTRPRPLPCCRACRGEPNRHGSRGRYGSDSSRRRMWWHIACKRHSTCSHKLRWTWSKVVCLCTVSAGVQMLNRGPFAACIAIPLPPGVIIAMTHVCKQPWRTGRTLWRSPLRTAWRTVEGGNTLQVAGGCRMLAGGAVGGRRCLLRCSLQVAGGCRMMAGGAVGGSRCSR